MDKIAYFWPIGAFCLLSYAAYTWMSYYYHKKVEQIEKEANKDLVKKIVEEVNKCAVHI